jgi:hypothetical protein
VETLSATRSGLQSSVLTRQFAAFSAGACGTFGAATVLTGAPAQGPLANGCYRYTLTGTDQVGNVASRVTTVRVDTTAPTGGALTVNGTVATSAGSTSSSSTGSWTIARTDFTDAESGLTSSTLVRTTASITNGVCGTFGGSTTITGAPSQTGTARTCYRYVLTGTNAFGLTTSLTTTVIVGPFVTGVQLLNGPGIAGRATQGDTVVITFSDTMNPNTFCSAWSTSGNQSIAGDNQVVVAVNQVGGGDTLTVVSTACTFNLGTIALGSTGYTSATALFGGSGANRSTIAWNAAARTLTITLGATGSGALGTVTSSVATYTPSTAIQNSAGLSMGGSFATANVQQF